MYWNENKQRMGVWCWKREEYSLFTPVQALKFNNWFSLKFSFFVKCHDNFVTKDLKRFFPEKKVLVSWSHHSKKIIWNWSASIDHCITISKFSWISLELNGKNSYFNCNCSFESMFTHCMSILTRILNKSTFIIAALQNLSKITEMAQYTQHSTGTSFVLFISLNEIFL